MKICKIHISNFNQFKNFQLDLTYPKGHKLEGKPLNKVCFIGQSGTGKTTLLEEIWDYKLMNTKQRKVSYKKNSKISIYVGTSVKSSMKLQDIEYITDSDTNERLPIRRISSQKELTNSQKNKLLEMNTIYFPVNGSKVSNFHENLNSNHKKIYRNLKDANNIYVFTPSISLDSWQGIEQDIIAHFEKQVEFSLKITKAIRNKDQSKVEKLIQALDKWERKNPTPLTDLAKHYLNPIINSFGLEVKTELENSSEINSIHLINSQGIPISKTYWSSGINNIIAKTIPLYTHTFNNSVICIDEPENSLYPDVQRKIIDLYTGLAPQDQFFFATHSPIVASCFEPWEIVELKLDNDGYVYREIYWEGSNHVNNYKFYPQYLRWDAILQNIFDLEEDGNDLRVSLLHEFSELGNQLNIRKENGEEISKIDTEVLNFLQMGKKLGWDTKNS